MCNAWARLFDVPNGNVPTRSNGDFPIRPHGIIPGADALVPGQRTQLGEVSQAGVYSAALFKQIMGSQNVVQGEEITVRLEVEGGKSGLLSEARVQAITYVAPEETGWYQTGAGMEVSSAGGTWPHATKVDKGGPSVKVVARPIIPDLPGIGNGSSGSIDWGSLNIGDTGSAK